MRSHILPLLFVILGTSLGNAVPPKVVRTEPANGDNAVDPKLREIRVTFDQAMSEGHSVVGSGENFPVITRKPRWSSSRTISIPVKLKPNHDYWLSINNDNFKNFTNRAGESAVPYPLSFRTAAGGASSKDDDSESASSGDNKQAIANLENAMTQHYSHRDRLKIDWPEVFGQNREALFAASSAEEFAKRAATLLARAEDKHLWLMVGDEIVPTFVRPMTPNANFKLLPTLVPNFKQPNRTVAFGRWEDGIGYIFIGTWGQSHADALMPIFDALWEMHDAPGLVIDVRANGGGDERLVRGIAGCFIDEPVAYAKNISVDPEHPGQFSPVHERVLSPNKRRPRYRGKIAVLMGPVNLSSCESFLMMMQKVPDAKLVGQRSQGSSGNPKPHDLGNGVTAYVPSWRDLTVDGTELEGVGVSPDIEVKTSPADFASSDPVLEAALTYLRGA